MRNTSRAPSGFSVSATPDIGTILVFTAVMMGTLLVAGARPRHIAVLTLLVGVATVALVFDKNIGFVAITGVLTGVGAGWLASIALLDVSSSEFVKGVRLFFDSFDVRYGLVKAASFGVAVTLIGCRQGLSARGGAQGVGAAATAISEPRTTTSAAATARGTRRGCRPWGRSRRCRWSR